MSTMATIREGRRTHDWRNRSSLKLWIPTTDRFHVKESRSARRAAADSFRLSVHGRMRPDAHKRALHRLRLGISESRQPSRVSLQERCSTSRGVRHRHHVTKVSGDNQSGSPGSALANPFVVEVKDEDGEVVEGIRVTFSVTAGGGSLSETSAIADEDGLAETTLTLGSQVGINSVQASVSGVDSVTFSTSVDAKILVAAANRPAMYWIAGGGLYRLTGAKEAKIAESANGVAIGGGKIYWTSQTSASAGAINSANLDGTDKKTLTSILAVPMGIAVDTAASKLYWTNTRGRIQSANLNGSGIQNVLLDLSAPTDIVVSNGFIYWTEGGNSVRRVNISGQKIAIDVAVNLDSVGGLAVSGGKVYWTETDECVGRYR